MQLQILIVDQDRRQRESLCALLTAVGLEVRGFDSLQEVDAATRRAAVLASGDEMDVSDGDGPSADTIPMGFVLLTNGEADGGPDAHTLAPGCGCFVKPLDLRALRGIRDLQAIPVAADVDSEMSGEPWIYYAARWTLKAPNGRNVQLTMIEARVVHCLMLRAGEVATREEILKFLQRPNLESLARNLDVTVSRLRKKVELMCWRKFPASSARGHGYMFNGHGAIVN